MPALSDLKWAASAEARLTSDHTRGAAGFFGAVDEQMSKEAAKVFSKQGLVIQTGIKITRVTAKKSVQVDYSDSAGAAQSATFDKLIVSIGRIPNTDGLKAAAIGLKLDKRRFRRRR